MKNRQSASETTPAIRGCGEDQILSAVVIGRNEGDRLLRCIRSLTSTCGMIVYVDSGSTDDSVSAAAALGAEVVELDLSKPFTAARARNAGFRRLRELHPDLDYVQFVDGDCEVLSGWLTTAADFLADHPEVAAVCGRRLEANPKASIYNAMCHGEWNTRVGEANACGGDFLIRAYAFHAVGGFADEQIAHEEPELCGRLRKAGFRIWRLDHDMTLHDAAIYHLHQFYKRSRRAGFGIAQALSRSGWESDLDGRSILRRAFIWAVALPIVTLIGLSVALPVGAGLLTVYPAQILRHAVLDKHGIGGRSTDRLKVALLTMIGKFAESQGAVEFLIRNLAEREMAAIYYK